MINNKTLLAVLFFSLCFFAFSQEDTPKDGVTDEAKNLPRTYRNFSLDMPLDELKAALAEDTAFVFRGDRDVSFLPLSDQNIVESAGYEYIKRAFFQLKDEKVFIMAFSMNDEKVDHYSLWTAFVEKYGLPAKMNPGMAMWENDETRIFIERPLTVKYINRTMFDEIAANSSTKESTAAQVRQQFLEDF